MKTIKRGGLLAVSFVFAIMLIGIVSAIGVGYPYWENGQVKMTPGEKQTINLNLQNNIGDADVTYTITLAKGASIASLTKYTYLVKAHTTSTMVPLVLSIPSDAKVGDKIEVNLDFVTAAADAGVATGTSVSLSEAVSVDFEVVVVQKPVKFPTTWIIVGILVLIVLIWLISAGRKKRKK